MVDWNYDTAAQGRHEAHARQEQQGADDPAFDAKHIVQYGFEPQRDDLRTMGAAFFGKGKFLSDDGKTVQIPDAWAAAWKWVYDGMWTDHFIMTGPVFQGQAFNGGGYAFNSGKVAMQENYLWDVCCVTDAGGNWDLAALPSYNGTVTAPINADTFRITKEYQAPGRGVHRAQLPRPRAPARPGCSTRSRPSRPSRPTSRASSASSSSRRTTRAS